MPAGSSRKGRRRPCCVRRRHPYTRGLLNSLPYSARRGVTWRRSQVRRRHRCGCPTGCAFRSALSAGDRTCLAPPPDSSGPARGLTAVIIRWPRRSPHELLRRGRGISKRFAPRLSVGERVAAGLGSAVETRSVHAVDRLSPPDRQGRGFGARRRIRLREVDPRPHHRRHHAADVRCGPHRRRARHEHGPQAVEAHDARADGVPGPVRFAQSAHAHRRDDRRGPDCTWPRRDGPGPRPMSDGGSMPSGWNRSSRAASRTSSRAASASASPLPARSPCSPTSSSATSRLPRSTFRSRPRSSTCS